MSDLAELFARDPLELTKDDITTIVEEIRKARHKFVLDEAAGIKPTGTTKKSKAVLEGEKALKETGLSIDLKGLLGDG